MEHLEKKNWLLEVLALAAVNTLSRKNGAMILMNNYNLARHNIKFFTLILANTDRDMCRKIQHIFDRVYESLLAI